MPLSNDSATALHVSNTSNMTLPASACASGRQIPFSNRGPGNECFASTLGDECEYACNDGYIGVGRHVCQTIYIENEAGVRWWKYIQSALGQRPVNGLFTCKSMYTSEMKCHS